MATSVVMPETGTVLKWYREEGDRVQTGDHICDIETDKTVIEIEAEAEGVLQRILVPEGTGDVEAMTEIALIASPEEAAVSDAPAAGNLQETDRSPTVTAVEPGEAAADDARNVGERARIFASPLARRLARESGIGLEKLSGSGPGGRIVERDVTAVLRAVENRIPAGDRVGSLAARADTTAGFRGADAFDVVPLSGMRRRIAERMAEAKQTIPHFYLSIDVELRSLIALREQIERDCTRDDAGEPRHRISINDFVVRSLALALKEVPAANVLWDGDRILRPKHIDLGVATAVDDGLMTPVVRDADRKSLASLSQEIRELAARARNRTLSPDEYQGGTSTVSNLGMYGVKEFGAIINPPQSSILAVGMASERVVARNGSPSIEAIASLTLSCDHRVIDGVTGANLLAAVKRLLETPINLML